MSRTEIAGVSSAGDTLGKAGNTGVFEIKDYFTTCWRLMMDHHLGGRGSAFWNFLFLCHRGMSPNLNGEHDGDCQQQCPDGGMRHR